MFRIALLAASIAATPALAEPLYQATLAIPTETTVIVRDAQWVCHGAACTAPRTATSSDANVCTAVVRKLGTLTAFTSGTKTFEPAQVEKCNAAAK